MIDYSKFPAILQTPEGTWNGAGVIILDGTAMAAVNADGGVKVVAEHDGWASFETPLDRPGVAILVFADGTRWTVQQGDGCNCQSPVKRWFRELQLSR